MLSRASAASSRRQLAGSSPDWLIARTHSAPRAKLSRLHAYPRLRDHAERALRAGEHAVGADARARTWQPARCPHADRGDRANRLDEVLYVRSGGGEVAGGARGDPASERGELERLGEVAQREPVLAQLRLENWARGPALNAGRA
jgi:hypothetical protein